MGLDLIISAENDFRKNGKGQVEYTVTQLYNLRNCSEILERLSWDIDGGFSNCGTFTFYEGKFHHILKELKDLLVEFQNEDVTKDIMGNPIEEDQIQYRINSQRERIKQVEYEISKLEGFFQQEGLNAPEDLFDTDDYITYGKEYQVHAWW